MLRLAVLIVLLGAEDPALKAARDHFAAGKRAFEAEQYEAAIQEFRSARALKPSPLLEYNIALAYERLGRLDLALSGYETYLRQDPAASNRLDVETRIRILRERMAHEGSYAVAPPRKPAASPGPERVLEPPRPSHATPPPSDTAGTAPATEPLPPASAGRPAPTPTGAPPDASTPPAPGRATGPGAAAPPPSSRPQHRFAVGLRVGPASSGGLGSNAFGGTVKVNPTGAFIAVPMLRASLPSPRLQAEGGLVLQSHGLNPGQGSFSLLVIRAKLAYVLRAQTRPIDVAFYAGIDFNNITVALKGSEPAEVSFWTSGFWAELLCFRYTLGGRHELLLSPLAFHLLPAIGSQDQQLTNPVSGLKEPAARLLDLAKPSLSYSFELGYALRF